MLALFGMGNDPKKLREKWLKLIWKAANDAPIAQRDSWVEKISTLSIQVGDVSNCLKAWELLPESARAEVFWGQHIMHLSAAERWTDAADAILKQISALTEARQDPVVELHAYAASALRRADRMEEADAHDAWVSKLYLGNANVAIRIANGYAFGADYQRAADWWARAVRQANPESSEFAEALKAHSEVLLEQGRWAETAATSEVLSSLYAESNLIGTSPLLLVRQRVQADMSRALSHLNRDRAGSLALLKRCHKTLLSDGSLADFFFPSLRKVGLIREHDQWFDETWSRMEKVISLYPDSDNTRNTTAWFASRAVRKLNEAQAHLETALAANPDQPAYLDTMAEIEFARGNRAKALEWSNLAINFSPSDSQLRRQHERFRSHPIPK
jgi:tetratricopeptide (TPR) repeat protein